MKDRAAEVNGTRLVLCSCEVILALARGAGSRRSRNRRNRSRTNICGAPVRQTTRKPPKDELPAACGGGIIDHAVRQGSVPREEFVGPRPRPMRRGAADYLRPDHQPALRRRLHDRAAATRPHHRVLEIGTGSGYSGGCAVASAAEVVTVERFRTLADARGLACAASRDNVEVLTADGFDLPGRLGDFDRIMSPRRWKSARTLSAAADPGGILLAPVGPHDGVSAHAHPRTDRIYVRKSCSRFASSRP